MSALIPLNPISSASLQDDSVLSAEARRLELMFTELPLLTLDHEF